MYPVHVFVGVGMKGTQTVFAGRSLVWRLRGAVQRYSEPDFDLQSRDVNFINDKAQEFLALVKIQSVDGGPDLVGEAFDSVSQPVLLSQFPHIRNRIYRIGTTKTGRSDDP